MATYTDLEEACKRLSESLAKSLEAYLKGISAKLAEAIEGPDLEALWQEGQEDPEEPWEGEGGGGGKQPPP